ncbi:hypothetical protein V2A60_008055 [Cordyceps javanica]|uniref:Ankyrin repeat domain-containing protein n=1 Tax=Cordyceps javanica TaxID=43265 RepID=A0A545VI85_9HYPO|nr:ankyrin repeat domain-containing protein [Cordyceps javanica]TQW01441.1 ankyrin repeat domain containing protein [Cordyceps javanica]
MTYLLTPDSTYGQHVPRRDIPQQPYSGASTLRHLPSPAASVKGASSHNHINISSVDRIQAQCLSLCSTITATCDDVAEKMAKYASSVSAPSPEFITLAREILGVYHMLACVCTCLLDAMRGGQVLPLDIIDVMSKKFQNAQTCLQSIEHVVSKLLEGRRKGTMSRMRRGFGKMFGDGGVEKVLPEAIRTHEDLRSGALMFHWNLGADRVESALGIGFLDLAAAVEAATGQPFRILSPSPASEENGSSHRVEPMSPANTYHRVTGQHAAAHPPAFLPPAPAELSFADQISASDYARGDSGGLLLGRDARADSPILKYTNSMSSSHHSRANLNERLVSPTGLHTFMETSTTALDAIVEDIQALELDSAKVFRLDSTPSDMPHIKSSSRMDADKPNAGAELVSAIRAGNHRIAQQLLDRGVSPDSGPDAHALNDAISGQDTDAVRLLLLYGVNPNTSDRQGQTPLMVACRSAQLEIAIALLKYGADPNMSSTGEMGSPLEVAVVNAHVRLAHVLLTYGGDANQMTSCGDTLLIKSIGQKTPKVLVDMLLNYGALPNKKNTDGKTALFQAVTNGRADIVASLMEHGTDPNLPGPKHPLWPATYHPECLSILVASSADFKKAPGIMELAASLNNMESIRILLKAGVDPNLKKDGVYTPLCTAIRDNRAEIFQLLIRSGADPNVPASEYPAFKCVTHHRNHFLPPLLAAGAKLDTPKGIVETAVVSKNPKAVRWLLENGADPNDKCPDGHTALTAAICDNDMECVDVLLLHGANPNIRGQDWPACMAVRHPEILKRILAVLQQPRAFKGIMEMAVAANQLESVKALRAAGVSVEDRNVGVFSPLTTAIREHRTDIVAFLIGEGGADVNAPGEHLPIVKALRRCQTEHGEIIDMLLDKGADPNKMYRGWNGIMQALENGDARMLKKLTDRAGVNLEVRDELGRTVVEIATSRKWDEAVDILMSSKAHS